MCRTPSGEANLSRSPTPLSPDRLSGALGLPLTPSQRQLCSQAGDFQIHKLPNPKCPVGPQTALTDADRGSPCLLPGSPARWLWGPSWLYCNRGTIWGAQRLGSQGLSGLRHPVPTKHILESNAAGLCAGQNLPPASSLHCTILWDHPHPPRAHFTNAGWL